jgi:hypothetical protein
MPAQKAVPKIGFFHMLRDVLVRSIDKGQFPLALFGLILIIGLIKMPGGEVSRLAFEVLANLKSFGVLGYILWLLTIIGWVAHYRTVRWVDKFEVKRISEARDTVQREALGDRVISSEAPASRRE